MSALRITDGHVRDVVTRPLSPIQAARIAEDLAGQGICVLVETGPVVHVTALWPTSTKQEVAALTAFRDATDARLAWHPAVADA